MSWFDVFKEDKTDEEMFAIVQESGMKILEMISKGRDKLYETAEPMVKDMMNLGIDEKIARNMVKGMIAPMLKDLDEREAATKKDIEKLANEKKK